MKEWRKISNVSDEKKINLYTLVITSGKIFVFSTELEIESLSKLLRIKSWSKIIYTHKILKEVSNIKEKDARWKCEFSLREKDK